MVTIHLNKLLFFSHHGVHNEETIVGTEFELNVSVSFEERGRNITSLDDTINYVVVYDIIKLHMAKPARLLETVVMNIATEIAGLHKDIKTINISISKLNPPINNFTGVVGVTYNKEFTV